jgi:curved DNA-binding protein CbpA
MAPVRQIADPYRELGVPRGADHAQIRNAYRALAKRFHPDAPGGDTVRFLAVQKAYLLLSDPLRRRDWDARHAPGPIRADADKPARPRRTDPDRRRAGAARAQAPSARASADAPSDEERQQAWSASDRDPSSRTHTWSAEGVPWWNDFRATGGAAANGKAAKTGASPGGTDQADADVYSRSSGAAWSMAARRYFRKGDADLPRRGVFRTRGTQVVTGAEARRVAEEEVRRAARVEDLLRSRPGASTGPRQSFEHDATPSQARGGASRASPASRPARPRDTSPKSDTNPHPAPAPTGGEGLVARVRRLMGLDQR